MEHTNKHYTSSSLYMITDREEASAAQCSLRVFEAMADLILSDDESISDEVSLQTMQVSILT